MFAIACAESSFSGLLKHFAFARVVCLPEAQGCKQLSETRKTPGGARSGLETPRNSQTKEKPRPPLLALVSRTCARSLGIDDEVQVHLLSVPGVPLMMIRALLCSLSH